jgi:GNAT superfamily N-acetyltransferase
MSPVAYIERWWVDSDFRGQVVGTLLVSAAEDWARSQPARKSPVTPNSPGVGGDLARSSTAW